MTKNLETYMGNRVNISRKEIETGTKKYISWFLEMRGQYPESFDSLTELKEVALDDFDQG